MQRTGAAWMCYDPFVVRRAIARLAPCANAILYLYFAWMENSVIQATTLKLAFIMGTFKQFSFPLVLFLLWQQLFAFCDLIQY